MPGGASGGEDDSADDLGERPRQQKPILLEHAASVGEIPQNARASPEQAESALGRTIATELDVDYADAVDADTKEEEEALAGHQVHPNGFGYDCLSWQPLAPDSVSAGMVRWEPARPVRQLARADFECSKESITAKLRGGLADLAAQFRDEMASAPSDFTASSQELDPTQTLMAELIVERAGYRAAWRQALPAATGPARIGPSLRLAGLGAAGTGKTRAAKVAINEARRRFLSYESVATMAFAGVAAANLGSGATTILRFRPCRRLATRGLDGERKGEEDGG